MPELSIAPTMSDQNNVDTTNAFCRDCGESIKPNAEICPNCGVRQQANPQATKGTFEQYTTIQWIAGVILGLLTFPIGLLIPAYFYIKSSNGTASEQGAWEAWAVILVGIFGIIAVELGGETGAKIILDLLLALPILLILAAVLASFVLGLGDTAQTQYIVTPILNVMTV